MRLIECLQTQGKCYNGTTKGKPVGVLWHDTSAGNSFISRYVQPSDDDPNKDELIALLGKNKYNNDWNHSCVEKGVNYFVGRLTDATIATVRTLPDNYRPWGCGSGTNGSCNGYYAVQNSPFWIQFEICDDGYESESYFRDVYREAVELTAYLCKTYGFDPFGSVRYNGVDVPTILCHADAHKLGLASDHGDVLKWFKRFGKTMDDVRRDVWALLQPPEPVPDPVPEPQPAPEPELTAEEMLGPYIYRNSDIPHASVEREMRVLLDDQAIDGGTPYEIDPYDINLPYAVVRALVVMKRYTDGKIAALERKIAELEQKEAGGE